MKIRSILYHAIFNLVVTSVAIAGGIEKITQPTVQPFIGISYSYFYISYPSFADTFEYLHGGAAYTFISAGKLPQNYNGLGFEAGAKFGHFFGFAFGLTNYFNKSTTIALNAFLTATPSVAVSNTLIAKITMRNAYFEARGYVPVGDRFNLIAALGGDFWDRSGKLSIESIPFPGALNGLLPLPGNDAAHQLHRLFWRIGAGANYNLTSHFGIQAMFHYMPVPAATIVINAKDCWTIDGSVFYTFSVL